MADLIAAAHESGHLIVDSGFFFIKEFRIRLDRDGGYTCKTNIPLEQYPIDCMAASLLAGGVAELLFSKTEHSAINLQSIKHFTKYAGHDIELVSILLESKAISQEIVDEAIQHCIEEISKANLVSVSTSVYKALSSLDTGESAIFSPRDKKQGTVH